MRILYIDPVFGLSGDMMMSALLDAGMPLEVIRKTLGSLEVEVPPIAPVRKQQGIITGFHLDIGHSYLHMSVRQMEDQIRKINADQQVKEDAVAMLGIILDAEAKVHGTTPDEVHLHELAHVDTLIDLIGSAVGIQYFEINQVYCGPLPHGRGLIKTAHGLIPNPAPVTLEILSDLPSVFCDETLELTTPTGAAIVRYYVREKGMPPVLQIERTGYGVGSYKSEKPDVLRLMIGTAVDWPAKSCEMGITASDSPCENNLPAACVTR